MGHAKWIGCFKRFFLGDVSPDTLHTILVSLSNIHFIPIYIYIYYIFISRLYVMFEYGIASLSPCVYSISKWTKINNGNVPSKSLGTWKTTTKNNEKKAKTKTFEVKGIVTSNKMNNRKKKQQKRHLQKKCTDVVFGIIYYVFSCIQYSISLYT